MSKLSPALLTFAFTTQEELRVSIALEAQDLKQAIAQIRELRSRLIEESILAPEPSGLSRRPNPIIIQEESHEY